MPFQNTNSSIISGYEYDPNMRVLHVQFRSSGEIRSYQGVPADVAREFADAASMGKFFHNKIRDQYRAL